VKFVAEIVGGLAIFTAVGEGDSVDWERTRDSKMEGRKRMRSWVSEESVVQVPMSDIYSFQE